MLPKYMENVQKEREREIQFFIFHIGKDKSILFLCQQGCEKQVPSYPAGNSINWNNFYKGDSIIFIKIRNAQMHFPPWDF